MGWSAGQGPQLQMNVSNESGAASQLQALNAMQDQKILAEQAAAVNGFGNQSNVFNQMQTFAGQLGQQAQGGGPNLALDQLNMTTGQNIANQSAMMGSQRGAGANVGMVARNAALTGANVQQQAVGQAAVQRAQQIYAAQQALQNQQALMGNVAQNQVGNQINTQNTYGNMAQQNQAQLLGTIGQQNQAQNQRFAAQSDANSRLQQQVASNQGQVFKGTMDAAGAGVSKAASSGMGAHGGMVPQDLHYAQGGMTMATDPNNNPPVTGAPYQASLIPKMLEHLACGGMVNYQAGGKIPGQAPMAGDNLKNDIVPAMLSPGEIVIPRSHAMDPNKAAAFARAIAMRNQKR